MEERNEDLCIAELFGFKGKKKNRKLKAKTKTKKKTDTETVTMAAEDSAKAENIGGDSSASVSGLRISMFDYSVENFFQDIDTIDRLCGKEGGSADLEQSEIQRISSLVTFLREWKDFKYPPRSVRFGCGSGSPKGKCVGSINLRQFSSATVSKYDMQKEEQLGDAKSQECRDFVMYVGGPVWAIDWCPQQQAESDCSIKCEYIAVATHPPGSSYHKMGAPLTGRGVIQIWCLLNIREPDEEVCSPTEKRKKGAKKDGCRNEKSTKIMKPRGRPRKNQIIVPVDDMNCETQYVPALDVQFPEDSPEVPTSDGDPEKDEETFPATHKRKRGPKKNENLNELSGQIKRPRGRPKKNSKEIIPVDMNCENESVQALAVQIPDDSAEFLSPDFAHGNCNQHASKQNYATELKRSKKAASACKTISKTPCKRSNLKINPREVSHSGDICQPLSTECENEANHQPHCSSELDPLAATHLIPGEVTAVDTNCENKSVQVLAIQDPGDSAEFLSPDMADANCNQYASQQNYVSKQKDAKKPASAFNSISKTTIKRNRLKSNCTEGSHSEDISQPLLKESDKEANHQPGCSSELGALPATHSIPGDLTLPRVVSCLAHNGKVAWDLKWRPPNMSNSLCQHQMGYLAVLLGNGSLEVWEVPLPRVLRAIYKQREGTDPRFIKLEPVFKCAVLKRGGLQSIPLTVEWSVTPPHDYLLAGCHDGSVALWKFSVNASSKCYDTKPVLCFCGDTVPIRTVAWAPFDGDPESSNIVVTAGHKGLKFWDLRNPFRPLRSLHPAPRIIYSLDWLSNPSCIIMSFDDGTMRTFSLVKAANELPVSGKTYTGKRQPWLHSSAYSSFAIWSVQVSRATGMVAYCGADGMVFRFQLTTKQVERESTNRVPFFLCGSVTEEESTLVINSPESNTPFPLKKSYDRGRHAESFRDLLSKSTLSKNETCQTKAANSNSQTLALCDGDDFGLESGSEEALSSMEKSKKRKSSHSKKKKPVESQALVCRDGVSAITPKVENEKSEFGNIPEVFPSKMVALHRVRWNMNKGSERWLCYGGAGGIVRCQEIAFSDIDKKWARKR